MEHFSYSFFLALMHSLWQAPVLLFIYIAVEFLLKRNHPVHKRNLLFLVLGTQVFLSLSTFIVYYTGSSFFYSEYIVSNLSAVFVDQPFILKASPWFIAIYLSVVIFKSLQLFFNWQQFNISGKAGWIKPSVDLRLFTNVKAYELGISRKVKIWYSNKIHTALTFGFFKPVILLPVALVNNLSVAETETLIIHELTHIKNNDYFLNWLLIGCETLFFFNPFIKIIADKVKLEREKNCDTQVLEFNYNALNYAETLIKAARFKTTPSSFFLAAVFKNAQLKKRILFFTNDKNTRFTKKNYNSIAIVPLLAMMVISIFMAGMVRNKQLLIAQKISSAVVYNEHINDQISTTVVPVSQADYAPAETGNIKQPPRKKVNIVQPGTIAKAPVENELSQPVIDNIIPASLAEPEVSKEITLKEESSGTGKSITRVFKMKMENGEWKTTLLWTITETRSASDSMIYLKDTSRFLPYSTQ